MMSKQGRRNAIASLSGKGLVEYGRRTRGRPQRKPVPEVPEVRKRQPSPTVGADAVSEFFADKERTDRALRNALLAADHNAKAEVEP